jgi:hypothetical protein
MQKKLIKKATDLTIGCSRTKLVKDFAQVVNQPCELHPFLFASCFQALSRLLRVEIVRQEKREGGREREREK